MKKINIINLQGSYYEVGQTVGGRLANDKEFQMMLENIKKLGLPNQNVHEIKLVLNEYCPQLLEELTGLQEGLKISEDETLRLFAGYDMPQLKMGCTSFITKDYYVRNYDFTPDIYDGLFITAKHQDGTFICGNAQLVTGRLDGMNSSGLVVGLHFVNNEQSAKGFLNSTIVRIILESCEDVHQAIDLLKELPHAASYNYSLLDKKGGVAVFEASPTTHHIRFGEQHLSCVNMFETKKMVKYNRKHIQTSIDRLNALTEYNHDVSAEEMHELFSEQSSPLFYTYYDEFFGTLHTVTYKPKENCVLLSAAGENHKLTL
ncbi:C45 family autoproteolytic acyltransferase/hydrolase [Bacillaceae bacterium W0354]